LFEPAAISPARRLPHSTCHFAEKRLDQRTVWYRRATFVCVRTRLQTPAPAYGMDSEALAETTPTCRMANRTPWDNRAPSASPAKCEIVPHYKGTEDYKRSVTEVIESERRVIDTLGPAKKTN
jgi:hypothetical protein